MEIPYLDLKIQYKALENQLNDRIRSVLESGMYVLGPEVAECEKKLAAFTGAPFAVTAASGTDALLMALLAADIGPGDEVITTSFSFFATAEVVALIGAKPVFVDIEPDTYNIDVSQIERAITSKTKAIMPVSLYGQVPDMDQLNALADSKNILVIEDAAQSFGATYGTKKSCNLSRFGCTSFFPAKPLGAFGEGGAVFCQTEADYNSLVEVRNHGQPSRYHHTRMGINGRLDTLQCAILSVKIERYPWEIEQRQRIAKTYNEAFANLDNIQIPTVREGRESVFAQYTLAVEGRDNWQKALKEIGVPTSVHYPKGIHQQPVMAAYKPSEPLSVTEKFGEQVFSLPLYADMPEDHVQYVIDSVVKVSKSL